MVGAVSNARADGPAGARLRALTSADLDRVQAIEEASQVTPWSPGNFRDCEGPTSWISRPSCTVSCTLAVRSIAGASSTVQPSERRSLSVITPAAGADIGARSGDGR